MKAQGSDARQNRLTEEDESHERMACKSAGNMLAGGHILMGPAARGQAAACATGSSTVQCKGGIHEQRTLSCGRAAAQGHTRGAGGALSRSDTPG